MRSMSLLSLCIAACAGSALPLAAQERSFNFALGAAVTATPDYLGSGNREAGGKVIFKFGELNFGGRSFGTAIGEVPDNGVSVGGAFRFLGERDAEDNPELAGLTDIDAAVELGLGVTYRQTNWLAFGEVRQGFGGHDGVTGTLGADLIMRPTDRWTVTAGPRLNLGNSNFANTYYGVSAADAGTSGFGAFDAEGGLLGAGLQVGASYRMTEKWTMDWVLSYEKLMNDAADSPITMGGSEDQLNVSFGLSRAFTLRF
ncbi:MltA-interacting MipA family protein [Sulfitobacter noctilucicola]|nr:MltA-interacting MipA family protein [Sulfitobacter noctilucicola]